jgi:biopolymer transport protein ExbB/TolQ
MEPNTVCVAPVYQSLVYVSLLSAQLSTYCELLPKELVMNSAVLRSPTSRMLVLVGVVSLFTVLANLSTLHSGDRETRRTAETRSKRSQEQEKNSDKTSAKKKKKKKRKRRREIRTKTKVTPVAVARAAAIRPPPTWCWGTTTWACTA